ncbi:hypothetical protein Golomagni_01524 [Golovinomyces magnicellulatus]|nr:hypothetical protein Golomagni_01524 [Golovinomyces magnicellulatus]
MINMLRESSTTYAQSFMDPVDHFGPRGDNFCSLTQAYLNHENLKASMDEIQLPDLMRAHTEEINFRSNLGKGHLRTKTLPSFYLPATTRDTPSEKYQGFSGRTSTSYLKTGDTKIMAVSKECENMIGPNFISEPFNFRHIKHTRHEHVSNLARRVQTEPVSESKIPSKFNHVDSELQNLKVDDLHFENFSSETLGAQALEEHRLLSAVDSFNRKQRATMRMNKDTIEKIPSMQASTFNESRKNQSESSPPPSHTNSIEKIPARKSSRLISNTNSALLVASERFYSKPESKSLFHIVLPTIQSPPSGPIHNEYFYNSPCEDKEINDIDSWPLPSSTQSSCSYGLELADVEEEDIFSDKVQNIAAGTQQNSFDYDEKLLGSIDDFGSISENGSLMPLKSLQKQDDFNTNSDNSGIDIDSWESDIDWCYENEAEADGNYRWIEEESQDFRTGDSHTKSHTKTTELQLPGDESQYQGIFSPTLLLPIQTSSPPGLSPSSAECITSPALKTPVNTTREPYFPKNSKMLLLNDPYNADDFITDIDLQDFESSVDSGAIYQQHFSPNSFIARSRLCISSDNSLLDYGSSSAANGRTWSFSQDLERSSSSTCTTDSINGQEIASHENSDSIPHPYQNSQPRLSQSDSHLQGDETILAGMTAFNLSRDTAKPPLLDRRNKNFHVGARLSPSPPSLTIPIGNTNSPEYQRTERTSSQCSNPVPRPQSDQNFSATNSTRTNHSEFSRNKSKSSSQAFKTRGKCSYGLFPHV